MNRPLVTIGVTAFNAAHSVQQALDSALAQTWRPIEVVIVDDCSSDNTWDLLQNLAEVHPELRVFRNQENGGVAVTRNRILHEAQGEFVAFFDDDDDSLPQRVQIQYDRIVEYEKAFAGGAPVICHTAREMIYPDGSRRLAPTMGQRPGAAAPKGQGVVRRILLGAPLKDGLGDCPTCSQMARLATYRALGGFDPRLRRSEDTDFNVRLAAAGGHFVGIARPLVVQHLTKTRDKSLPDERRFFTLLLDKHKNLLKNPGQHRFARGWLDAKFDWLEGRRGIFLKRLIKLVSRHPLRTLQRLFWALPNLARNRAFGRFHAGRGS